MIIILRERYYVYKLFCQCRILYNICKYILLFLLISILHVSTNLLKHLYNYGRKAPLKKHVN